MIENIKDRSRLVYKNKQTGERITVNICGINTYQRQDNNEVLSITDLRKDYEYLRRESYVYRPKDMMSAELLKDFRLVKARDGRYCNSWQVWYKDEMLEQFPLRQLAVAYMREKALD